VIPGVFDFGHPCFDFAAKGCLDGNLTGRVGVERAEFEHRPHLHSLLVKYDPDSVKGMEILQLVRKHDPAATIVGL